MWRKFDANILCSALVGGFLLTGCSTFDETPPATNAVAASPSGEVIAIADELRAGGDNQAAAALYLGEVRRNPDDLTALVGLAESLRLAGDCTGASGYYDRALALSPADPQALAGYGRCAIALDRPELAARLLAQAVEASPEPSPGLFSATGVAHDLIGDHDAAQLYYRRGLTETPQPRSLLANLALSLALQGHFREAGTLLRSRADAPGATAGERQNLALVLALSGARAEALRYGRMDLSPDDAARNLTVISELALDLYGADPARKAAARRALLAPQSGA
ncbi:tetratricopeptide repeat protein [Minwuia thermotolerans]|uniref:Tetratrico peptide repeat group 5 domain-containing protein n=1 Tax=Minwuia thermotolerans TaxID=2056226 RepID=A0A2M9G1W6_9PROT|nr:tetratricopeptide repeat protein [Minwuia thermotolerans]PJK29708.1 hypothetical protein CVT23_11755 [Minwuia thermotolerans]